MSKHTDLQIKLWDYYRKNKRDFPWRETIDPYHILISEVMLQQTQTSRVIEKYHEFLKAFPTIQDLAQASSQKLLKDWQGLGYNRRALWLKQTAHIVVNQYDGTLPDSLDELVKLPGIGKNTAGAILAFAFNQPTVFIETNIRRVYIHEFFSDKEGIDDKDILPLIEQTLDRENPREFYYALMDYGSSLPKQIVNPNRKSKHYTKQSKFKGSIRQTRGQILKMVIDKSLTKTALLKAIESPHVEKALKQLLKEGFIEQHGNKLTIPS